MTPLRATKLEDPKDEVQKCRQKLALRPEGHPRRSSSLLFLAIALQARFDQEGRMEDLTEAISLNREALAICPAGDPSHSVSLNNLANALKTRFEQKGEENDLDEAIVHNRNALSLRPEGHPLRGSSLNNLAGTLITRFEETGEQEDLDEAITHHLDALSLRPNGHPDRLTSLNNLVTALMKTHKSSLYASSPVNLKLCVPHSGEHTEIAIGVAEPDYMIGLLESAVQHEISSLKDRLSVSFTWIMAARRLGHESVPKAYSAALALLARISMQRSTLESQHESFSSRFYNIPKSFISDAASSAIEAGMIDTAVEFLEQGRGLLWSRMKGYRHPLLQLRETNPELAKRYETLGTELERHATTSTDVSGGSPVLLERRWQEYRKLSEDWDEAAAGGPVILINVSKYRSDAIIVSETNDTAVIPLPQLPPQTLEDLVSQFLKARASDTEGFTTGLQAVLREMWELVVEPVVKYLKASGLKPKSRIWWCPTGKLCALPLHAAGPYAAKTRSLPDIYVSSYTPTLTALISARENLRPNLEIPRMLVVGEPDQGSIPAVEEEVRRLKSLGPFVDVLTGEEAGCDNVIQSLTTHSWSHFACHGKIHSIPFHSSFKLYNGQRLELIELIKARLPEAEFAFLSACHAAAVDVKDAPDEVIHLSAAMQFSGFRSVVGTLWAMADEDGPDVSEDFYKHMFRNLDEGKVNFRDAGTALNLATREMRRKRISLSRWVNFVHIGA